MNARAPADPDKLVRRLAQTVTDCANIEACAWTQAFVLRNARADPQVGSPTPADIPLGPPKQCFANAGRVAMLRPELTYVEGFAMMTNGFVFEHAWIRTDDGRIIDPTLRAPQSHCYLGVPFAFTQLTTLVSSAGNWGVLEIKGRPNLELMKHLDPGLEQHLEDLIQLARARRRSPRL